jgi:hypothetical protein
LPQGVDEPTPTFLLELTKRPFPPISINEENRLVDEAVVEKRLVVVACVVVLRSARNPPVNVDEAVDMKPSKKPRVVEVALPHV